MGCSPAQKDREGAEIETCLPSSSMARPDGNKPGGVIPSFTHSFTHTSKLFLRACLCQDLPGLETQGGPQHRGRA